MKKTVLFIITSKKKRNDNKKKYLGINLTKHMQDVYAENYKMLMKEITEDLNTRRNICSWIGRVNIVKTSFFPRLIEFVS